MFKLYLFYRREITYNTLLCMREETFTALVPKADQNHSVFS